MHVHDIMRHAAAGSHVRHTCRHTSVQSPIVLVNIASKYILKEMSLRAKRPLKHLDNAENPIPSPISELCVCELFKLTFCQIYSSQISMYYVQAYAYLGKKRRA